jgi:hypothetical protein
MKRKGPQPGMKNVLILSSLLLALCLHVSATLHGQGVGINDNGNPPDPSAILDAASSSQGMLIPRMTTGERDLIASPAQALQIYNTTTKCFEFYDDGYWQPIVCSCALPSAPSAGTHSAAETAVTWNWNSVSGAAGYRVSATNNYATATDVGNVTSYEQTGLACGQSHTLYVWTYTCGPSAPLTLTHSTLTCWSCGNVLNVEHTAGDVAPVNKSVGYGTVSTSLTGSAKCWITQNLGASNEATSATDATEAASGWYWQFNQMRGYKHDGSLRTPNTAWVSSISENSAWVQANDPCYLLLGSSWRIPTSTEWIAADANGGWDDYLDTYASVLKIHAAGLLSDSDGSAVNRGLVGYYRSSNQANNTSAASIYMHDSWSDMGDLNKALGFPVRCIMD